MTLSSGTKLGPYEILAPIGAGGMGEVYRARDTRLERDVAVKVLPAHLSSSPEMRQRFEREAKTISALSHPHICALYDVGNQDGVEYLVMEYLEGETLAERVLGGPLPLDQTLRFGAQMASALQAAHRKGIIHRDLKPSNVMVTKSGVKLLDFGLAKALMPAPTMESLTSAPTAAKDLSSPGTILGTVPYMAPEVLQGKEADSRADIFALGAVLHEVATGTRAFDGTSPVSIMSAILTSEPPLISSLQPISPPSLDRLVRTCLAKDPDDRWQTARDVELQLSAIADGVSAPQIAGASPRPSRTRWLPWLAAGIALAIAAIAMYRKGPPVQPQPTIHFSVPPPANGAFSYFVETSFLAVSPDGSRLAYVASDPQGGQRIFLRPLSAPEARPIPGTEGASSLFFSPDGRSIAFFAASKLKRVELSGGSAAVSICDVSLVGPYCSGSWGRGGDILFAGVTRGKGIFRVSSEGGIPAEVIRVDPSRDEARVGWPWFLPDGKRFLYLLHHPNNRGDLMLAEPGKRPRPILAVKSAVQYVDPGYLVFAKDGILLAQRFDPESGRVTGEPLPVAVQVRYFLTTGSASFAASPTGTLAYQSQESVRRLSWFDRTGRELGSLGPRGNILNVSIAPGGRRALFDRARPGIGTYGVWSVDLERGTETPVTPGPDTECYPVWLPGERDIGYSIDRGGAAQLFRRNLATGREEKLLPGAGFFQVAEDVSPDGRSLVYSEASEHGWFDIWTLPLTGGGKPAAFLRAPFAKTKVRFSPDGRYLAMISREAGQLDVYVTPYPGPGERTRVSTGGARSLRWSRNGEIVFLSGDNRMMAVPIQTTPSLKIGPPAELFALKEKSAWVNFDVSPDGKRFLAVVPEVVADELPLEVIVNWTAALEKQR